MQPETKIVMYPCPRHLPRGRTYRMGDALGDLFWEHPNGTRVRFASCRECAEGKPAYVEDMGPEHRPLHHLPPSRG